MGVLSEMKLPPEPRFAVRLRMAELELHRHIEDLKDRLKYMELTLVPLVRNLVKDSTKRK